MPSSSLSCPTCACGRCSRFSACKVEWSVDRCVVCSSTMQTRQQSMSWLSKRFHIRIRIFRITTLLVATFGAIATSGTWPIEKSISVIQPAWPGSFPWDPYSNWTNDWSFCIFISVTPLISISSFSMISISLSTWKCESNAQSNHQRSWLCPIWKCSISRIFTLDTSWTLRS